MQLNHIHFHPIKLVRFSLLKTATSILLTCKEVGIDPNAVLGSYYRVSFLLLQPFFPRKASAFRAPSGDRQAKRGWGGGSSADLLFVCLFLVAVVLVRQRKPVLTWADSSGSFPVWLCFHFVSLCELRLLKPLGLRPATAQRICGGASAFRK